MLALSPRVKAIILALGLFAIGIVCGIAADRWMLIRRMGFFMRPQAAANTQERLLRRYIQNLGLTPQQEQEIKRILDESRESMRTIRRKVNREIRGVARATESSIRDILTPEQRRRYNRWLRRRSPQRAGPKPQPAPEPEQAK